MSIVYRHNDDTGDLEFRLLCPEEFIDPKMAKNVVNPVVKDNIIGWNQSIKGNTLEDMVRIGNPIAQYETTWCEPSTELIKELELNL